LSDIICCSPRNRALGGSCSFIAIVAGFVAVRGGTLVDFAWGASVGVIWSVCYFLYRLCERNEVVT